MAIGLLEQRQGKKKMEKKGTHLATGRRTRRQSRTKRHNKKGKIKIKNKKRHALGDRKEDAETVSHKEAQQKRKNKNKK